MFLSVAQNRTLDSLKQVIATSKVDTVKGRTLCRLCRAQRRLGAYKEALQAAQAGLSLLQKAKDKLGEGECYLMLAVYHMSQLKMQGYPYTSSSFAKAQEIGNLEWQYNGSRILFIFDSTLGNWKNAFKYSLIHKTVSDSII